jgi:outer membrane biosynthesis protein TonB
MAGVRQDRGGILVGSTPGRRSVAILVAALAVVLIAIAMVANFSRRQAGAGPPAMENVTLAAAPVQAAEAEPEPEPVVSPARTDEGATSARKQTTIARAVEDGRPSLATCYQRALVKDDSLVHGKVTVRVAIAASGRVERVRVAGPAPFRAIQPCLATAIAKWDFPSAPAAYATEFPLVMQGRL